MQGKKGCQTYCGINQDLAMAFSHWEENVMGYFQQCKLNGIILPLHYSVPSGPIQALHIPSSCNIASVEEVHKIWLC